MKKTVIAKVAIALFAGILISAFAGCQNVAGGGAALTSFVFEKRLNNWLEEDIVGVIDYAAQTVTVTVPEAAYRAPGETKNKKFKASFTLSPKAKLYKGTKEQKSGELEELFIDDKKYNVVSESGSKITYTVRIKIAYKTPAVAPADAAYAAEIEKFYGTYRGILNFDNNRYKIWIIHDKEYAISYSNPMSSHYINMSWERVSASEWICRTYHRKDFERTDPRSTTTFTVAPNGTVSCKIVVNAMGNAPSDTMQKGPDYIFSPGDGEGFKEPSML